MAAPPIAKPGTRYGHCLESCEHDECVENRQIARKSCIHCSHPIGYDQPFVRVDIEPSAAPVIDQAFVHGWCKDKDRGLSAAYHVFGPDADGHPRHYD